MSASLPPDESPSNTLTAPDRIFPLTRHFSYILTPVLIRTPVTPNVVTALSLISGLASAWYFTVGTWSAAIAGAALLVLCYTLDNCDGEIARLKNLSSEWGARFDDLVDWLVDSAFFAALGYGTYIDSGNIIWLWFGLVATAGATIDYVIDLVHGGPAKKDPAEIARKEAGKQTEGRQGWRDWLMNDFHTLSRADFCFIVFALALFDVAWVLVPLGAIGAQAYWIMDLIKHARNWGR